jgi:hypothetical protein
MTARPSWSVPLARRALAGTSVLVLSVCSCLPRQAAPGPPEPLGLISGIVSTPSGNSRREVSATNILTHRVYRARTSDAGVFGLLVPAGTYHLAASARRNETVVDQPADVTIGGGENKRGITIVIGRKAAGGRPPG